MNFLRNVTLTLENIFTGEISHTEGMAEFMIENPADFRVYKYTIN